jgi:pyruvate dehydrogenase E2 component (dihydrolipoamide acetyltransferase)
MLYICDFRASGRFQVSRPESAMLQPTLEDTMPTDILMPALSPTMEKGNLSRWLKKEGDSIKSGDVIAEIETDKATMEVEAVDDGILAKIVVPEGTADVPVNDVIGVIASEGEDVATTTSAPRAATASTPQAPAAPARAEVAPAQATSEDRTKVQPRHEGAASRETTTHNGTRIVASPLARRIAEQANLDLSTLAGSGPHGRIVERDVRAALATVPATAPERHAEPPIPAAPLPTAPSDEAIENLYAPGTYEKVPHDSMRRTIARRLLDSSRNIPHFTLTIDCALDALLSLRETINAAAPKNADGTPAYKISVNDFIVKALALALVRVPDANVTWTENAMLRHSRADVGVAVAIPGGLITPVIRAAETKTLSVISNEMKDLASRARARKLKPEEYQGGATAVSNLGMYGIKNFSAIINPPHATILAVGAGEQRMVVKGGEPALATVMTVTLSTDHRAVDGALGAELLAAFKTSIESPLAMLV